jgi:penicillin-binding protein 1C
MAGGAAREGRLRRLDADHADRAAAAARAPDAGDKLREILAALRLERELTKDEILSVYLTLAPFGGNIEGVRAAALGYFGKRPAQLTDAEAALLVALPQAPEARRPDHHPRTAAAAAAFVLDALEKRGITTRRSLRATADGPNFTRLAPHFSARAAAGGAGTTRTTVDGRLQRRVEDLVRATVQAWPPPTSMAVVILRNRDASVAAYVGGADPFDASRDGAVDLAAALRSPGSTLKPFIYAMAIERRIVHPETVVTDAPVDFDGYTPENFDGTYAGDLTVRSALARSVNTVAVALLDEIGPEVFLAHLRGLGLPLETPLGDKGAGLPVGLGGAGISLLDLTRMFSALAAGGEVRAMRTRADDPAEVNGRLVSASAAASVLDILADVGAPEGFANRLAADGGRRIAYKTGTSYGFRDAWAVGVDADHTVGVWVGRPDGKPNLGGYGVSVAAPVLMRVFDMLPTPTHAVAGGEGAGGQRPVRVGGYLPPRLRRFVSRGTVGGADRRLTIAFPRDGATVTSDTPGDKLVVETTGGTPPFRWLLNRRTIAGEDGPRLAISPPGTGQAEIQVTDSAGTIATASFWYEAREPGG